MRRQLLNAFISAMLVAAVAGRGSVLAKGLTFDELRQRSQEIERMTQVERDSLQRNWRNFQALPEDRKQRYRLLHQQLDEDRLAGGQLNQTMQTYEAWLQTLTPGERAELREATGPADRLAKVQRIKADKDRRNQSRALRDPADDPSPRRWRIRAKPLASTELDAVMDALADALPIPDRDNLKRFDPEHDRWQRYRQIVTASARQAGGALNWPNLNQQADMAAAIPESETARLLKSLTDDQRRGRWGAILFSSFGAELRKGKEPFRPKQEDLAYFFERLDNIQREELMSLPRELLHQELTRLYYRDLSSKNADFRQLSGVEREFFAFAWPFMTEAEFFRGGGPMGPGRRFSSEGRGFRDDRDRDGPPPDRPPREDHRFRPRPPNGDRPPPPDRPRDE